MKQKHFFALLLAAIFCGCVGDGIDTIVLPEKDRGSGEGDVPSSIIPNPIRTDIESTTPIYSGTTPPNMSGQYKVSNLKPNGGSGSGGSEIGNITELLLDFSTGKNGECTLSYRETRGGVQYGSDNIKARVVGSGSNFSVYFTTSEGRSYVISGTYDSRGGISNLYYVVVINNDKSCGCSSFRSFKDGSGYSGIYAWNGTGSSGEVPTTIIPPVIKNGFEKYMPIYSGTTPPDISGQYIFSSPTLAGSSISGDETEDIYDIYMAFVKNSNGTFLYKEDESDFVGVSVVGSGNNFTAYFDFSGEAEGIRIRTAYIISGTLTSGGISNFRYGYIMLEKGSDPSNKLVPVNTYRVFKDGDGLAERYNWMVLPSSSSKPSSSSSFNGNTFVNCQIEYDGYLFCFDKYDDDPFTYDECLYLDGTVVSSCQSSSSAVRSSSSAVVSSSSLMLSSSSSSIVIWGCDGYEPIVSSCDMSGYRTVDINGQIWMAENLNCNVAGSKCGNVLTGDGSLVDENTTTCDTYGRLYDWCTAMSVCPSGWHLPSNDEWQKLVDFAGGDLNGEDKYGFSALPGGSGTNSSGNFTDVGYGGYWWSASESNRDAAYGRYMHRYVWNWNSVGKSSYLFSVRYLQDN